MLSWDEVRGIPRYLGVLSGYRGYIAEVTYLALEHLAREDLERLAGRVVARGLHDLARVPHVLLRLLILLLLCILCILIWLVLCFLHSVACVWIWGRVFVAVVERYLSREGIRNRLGR